MNVLSKITFQSNCNVLKDVRERVREICEQQDANKKITENIILAVNEACMNIIQHGYENNPNNEFTLLVALAEDKKSNKKEIVIQLIDQAEKIDPSKIKSRNLNDVKPGGIGVHMINELMDSVDYLVDETQKGNTLELRKIL